MYKKNVYIYLYIIVDLSSSSDLSPICKHMHESQTGARAPSARDHQY